MDELVTLIARMVRHYREGGAGYTWLDAALDVVGEHGCVILNQNRDDDGPAAILINEETLASTRQMIHRLRQVGVDTEMVTGCGLAELDEEAGVIRETLSDLLIELLVEAGLVQPLVASQARRTITDGHRKQPSWPKGWGGLAVLRLTSAQSCNILWVRDRIGRGSKSAEEVRIEVLKNPPAVKVRRVFCFSRPTMWPGFLPHGTT